MVDVDGVRTGGVDGRDAGGVERDAIGGIEIDVVDIGPNTGAAASGPNWRMASKIQATSTVGQHAAAAAMASNTESMDCSFHKMTPAESVISA